MDADTHGLCAYSDRLRFDPDSGLYRVAEADTQPVSYPGEGHRTCAGLEGDSAWFLRRNRLIVEAVRRWPPEGPVFDVGGGNGFVAAGLEAAGWPTVLVEPGPDGCRTARERGLERVVCASFADAGFRDGSLPAVGLFDVLEHVADDAGFLRLAHRALRPGGRLYLTVPAFPLLWSAEDEHAGHFRRYLRPGLASLLAGAGLRCEFAAYFFAALFPLVLLLRALPSRLGLYRKTPSRTARQHRGAGLLDPLLAGEAWLLGRGLRLPLGTSLLAVGRRD